MEGPVSYPRPCPQCVPSMTSGLGSFIRSFLSCNFMMYDFHYQILKFPLSPLSHSRNLRCLGYYLVSNCASGRPSRKPSW